MKLYIVYEGAFDIDKPRTEQAEPYIRLLTNQKDEAKKELEKILKVCKSRVNTEEVTIYSNTNEVEFEDGYTFFRAGIIIKEVYVNLARAN